MRFGFLLAIVAATAFAQLRVGIKAGIPATAYFDTGAGGNMTFGTEYSAATRRYTVGASAEWRWAGGFGFEADVLYQRMGWVRIETSFWNGLSSRLAYDVKGNSWDVPLMAKYRLAHARQLFVVGGGVLRYVGPVRAIGENTVQDVIARTTTTTRIDTADPPDLTRRTYAGLTAGAGIELGRERLRILPEVRYTRWLSNIGGKGSFLRFEPNQFEVLVGVLF